MKTRLLIIAGALLTTLLGTPAYAQPAPGNGGMGGMNGMGHDTMQGSGPGMGAGMGPGGPGPRAGAPRDCKQARDPAACAAHRENRDKAFAACKESRGAQRQQCMHEQMQNIDCSKTGNPERCEAHKAAHKACEGQSGPAFHRCVQEKMPPADCGKSPNPQRCEKREKSREACMEKAGPEHKACLHEQFRGK